MSKKPAIALVVLVPGGIAWMFLAGPGAPSKPQAVLPDGSILTVEQITTRAPHQFHFDNGSVWSRLARVTPAPLRRYLPPGGGTATASASSNAIVLWVSLFHAQSNRYVNPSSMGRFEVVDEHGCTASSSSYNGHGGGTGMVLTSLPLDSFPRRSPTFKLRVRNRASTRSQSDDILAELEMPNPVAGPFPEWRPESLPIVRANGELTFVLQSFNLHRSGGRVLPGANLKVFRDGQPAQDWSASMGRFSDATGNSGYEPFCTNEPAWKAAANFLRNEKAEFSPEEMLVVTNLAAPVAGRIEARNDSAVVQGVRIELLAMAGAGDYTYSNGVGVAAAPLTGDASGGGSSAGASLSVSTRSSNGVAVETLKIKRASPHLVLRMGRMADDQHLMIRGRDERGRLVVGDYSGRANDKSIVRLKVLPDAQRLDLEIIVHRGVLEEFIVAPPRF